MSIGVLVGKNLTQNQRSANIRMTLLLMLAYGLAGTLHYYGMLVPLFIQDNVGIPYIIVAITHWVIIEAYYGNDRWLNLVIKEGVVTLFGICGTVLGFIEALKGMAQDDSALKLDGAMTASMVTVIGIVCHLFLIAIKGVRDSE